MLYLGFFRREPQNLLCNLSQLWYHHTKGQGFLLGNVCILKNTDFDGTFRNCKNEPIAKFMSAIAKFMSAKHWQGLCFTICLLMPPLYQRGHGDKFGLKISMIKIILNFLGYHLFHRCSCPNNKPQASWAND